MRNTAGSAGYNETADFIVTITSDPYLEKFHLFLHTIIKSRFGPKMVTFLSECNIMNMRVRSASNNVRKQYSEAQMNETMSIVNFNRKPDEENNETPIKTSEEIAIEKKNEEVSRFKKIEHEVIRQEREKAKDGATQTMQRNFMDDVRRRKEENKEHGI
jgi:pyruvate/2-oxoacid:ferredoxin oxidoreductase beta subunit